MHHEPEDCDARQACNFWFPQPASVPIHICDFRHEGGSRYTDTLGHIENCELLYGGVVWFSLGRLPSFYFSVQFSALMRAGFRVRVET